MIHEYVITIKAQYDDENGEYTPLSEREVERVVGNAIYRPLIHLGFEKLHHLEVERIRE